MQRLPLLLALLTALLFTPGFVCASRVERLEGEVDALRLQFEEIQQRVNDDQAEVTGMMLRADEKLGELEELQRQYQDVLSKGILDMQLEIDQTRKEVAQLRGKLDITSHNLDKLQDDIRAIVQTLGVTSSGQAIQLPQGANDLFQFGQDAYNAGKYDVAAAAYQEFWNAYASDSRIDTALYLLADSYKRQGRNVEAIGVVKEIMRSYSNSKKLNDAIFIMGEAACAQGDAELASNVFTQLKGTSSHGDQARKALKRVQNGCP